MREIVPNSLMSRRTSSSMPTEMKKRPSENVAERPDDDLDLMAIFGFGNHHPGEKRAERERQAGEIRSPRRSQHDEQHGEREELAQPRLWAITWKSGRSSQRPAASTTMSANAPPERNSSVRRTEKSAALPRASAEASARSGTKARS